MDNAFPSDIAELGMKQGSGVIVLYVVPGSNKFGRNKWRRKQSEIYYFWNRSKGGESQTRYCKLYRY